MSEASFYERIIRLIDDVAATVEDEPKGAAIIAKLDLAACAALEADLNEMALRLHEARALISPLFKTASRGSLRDLERVAQTVDGLAVDAGAKIWRLFYERLSR